MKTTWDYSQLAEAYISRPDYADRAIDDIFNLSEIKSGSKVCDVGAGVGHLTIMLLKRKMIVTAVEPNDEMRKRGIMRTENFQNITWFEAAGEDTKQSSGIFDLVTFGSSFNVVDQQKTLLEVKRILKPEGWFACMWNHRDINDKIQQKIESIIKGEISEYDYGVRRQDQTEAIDKSNLFKEVKKIEAVILHKQTVEDCIVAWKSHATLQRQAENKFPVIINKIEEFLHSLKQDSILVPYTTRIWLSQLK